MQDFKLLTRQLLETYLGSDTLSDVAIQDFLDSNVSIIGTGKQEFFKNIEHFEYSTHSEPHRPALRATYSII